MVEPTVLLINCPAWGVTLPPLGIAYVAADLEHRGIPCDVLDLNILLYFSADSNTKKLWKMENYHIWSRQDHFQHVMQKFLTNIEWWANEIVQRGVKIVGFSVTGASILFSIEVARMIKSKSKDICIVFGGPACNFLHNNSRMPFRFFVSVLNGTPLVENGIVDYITLGEGEGALAEIVSAYKSGRLLKRAGVVVASFPTNNLIKLPQRIDSLDAIPFPVWEKFSLDKYSDKRALPILFSRGCINKCTFCNDWIISSGAFRYRSAANIFEEISVMQKKIKRNTFRCHDLLFNGNLKVLDQLADLIIQSGLKVNWTAQGVIRTDMEADLLRKLRMAGLVTIIYGVESLSDNVLKAMGKRFTFDDVRIVLERTKKANMSTAINLIIGFPTETEEDFATTMRRLGEIRKYLDVISSLNLCYIMASSELERFPERFALELRDGEDRRDYWESLDGRNTYEARNRRMREMLGLLQNLGLKAEFVGMYDGDALSEGGGE